MSRLFILVFIIFNSSFLFAQDPNKNIFSQDEVIKLSSYAIELEHSILDKDPSDSILIAKLKGDYLLDLYGYSDKAVIKISNYLKELEIQDSINNIPEIIDLVEDTNIKSTTDNDFLAESNGLYVTSVLFDVNSSSPKEIDLFDFIYDLKLNKKLRVLLVGHTDGSGTDNYNLDLSIIRAIKVKKLLISKGVLASRIEIDGEGEWEPTADNATEAGRALNRRVEISVK
jgi:outer membrane protein OmpA-like peptidoglycan-associated protein